MATEACPDGHWKEGPISQAPGLLRVGFLTPNLIVGGVESWLISLVRELQTLGSIHVSGVGHTAGEGLWSPIIAQELGGMCPIVSSASIPGAARVSSPVKAAQAVAAASDVLIVWSVTPAILAACQGPRIVGVSHGCNDWWMADSAKLVDEWVAVAEVARTPCPDPARVHVIPNGVDVARCNSSLSVAQARERLGLPAWARVAGYVGRFSSEKRVQQIAESINWLPQDWHLLFVGDGRDKIEPSDRVHVLPPTRNVGDIWRACDVAVVASEAEGYCLSAVEALAAGVPLASTQVGIMRDLPTEYVPIEQPANPQAIAAAIMAAYHLGPSSALARWARTEASAAKMAERWAEFLASVASPQ